MTDLTPCPCGCGRTFAPAIHGGHAKRFYSPSCKRRVESAVRTWGMKAFLAGTIGLETLAPHMDGQNAVSPSRATEPAGLGTSEAAE